MPQSKEQIKKGKEIRLKFIEELKSTKGNVSAACHRLGVARDSFYRWRRNYKRWDKEIGKVLEEERAKMNDYVEMKLFKQIEMDSVPSIIFYLKCHHPEYQLRHLLTMTNKLEVEGKLSPQDKKLIEKAVNYGLGQTKKEINTRPELPKKAV